MRNIALNSIRRAVLMAVDRPRSDEIRALAALSTIQLLGRVLPSTVLVLFVSQASADVITDGSFGPATALSGSDILIDESLGIRAGDNLFHSFTLFDVLRDQSITFTGSPDIANVISRVTGDSPTTINGHLESQVGSADFYLINPQGIIFGDGASVDLPASFYVTTSDYLTFSDTSQLSTTAAPDSSLSIASPESFGFLSSEPSVTDGAVVFLNTDLQFAAANDLNVFARNISLIGSGLKFDDSSLLLYSVGSLSSDNSILENAFPTQDGFLGLDEFSDISVAGANSYIELVAAQTSINSSFIEHENSSNIDASGFVYIGSNDLVINQSAIDLFASNAGAGASLVLDTLGETQIDGGSVITASTNTSGFGGDIDLVSGDFSLATDSIISTFTESSGSAGLINIETAGITDISQGANIASFTSGAGATGDITIETGDLIVDSANIRLESTESSDGDLGNVNLNVFNQLLVNDGAQIGLRPNGAGGTGNAVINAGNLALLSEDPERPSRLTLSGGSLSLNVMSLLNISGGIISSTSFRTTDNPGSISIAAGAIDMVGFNTEFDEQFSIIQTSVFDDGTASFADREAGEIDISVAGEFRLLQGLVTASVVSDEGGTSSASPGNIRIDADQMLVKTISDGIVEDNLLDTDSFSAGVYATSEDGSSGGNITIQIANDLDLQSGLITTSTLGTADAGQITMTATNLLMGSDLSDPGVATIRSSSLEGASGNAGSVVIEVVEDLSLRNGSIASNVESAGLTGEIDITAGSITLGERSFVNLRNYGSSTPDDESSSSQLSLVADTIMLEDGAVVTSESRNVISSGDINLIARQQIAITGSSGVSSLSDFRPAGDITMEAELLTVDNSRLRTSASGELSDGGDINVNGRLVILQGGFVQANALSGNGGEINIDSEAFLVESGALQLGGDERLFFIDDGPSVVQAVAPNGVNGFIGISAPEFDVSSLLNVTDPGFSNTVPLQFDPCSAAMKFSPSTLVFKGRGALALNNSNNVFAYLGEKVLKKKNTLKKLNDSDREVAQTNELTSKNTNTVGIKSSEYTSFSSPGCG